MRNGFTRGAIFRHFEIVSLTASRCLGSPVQAGTRGVAVGRAGEGDSTAADLRTLGVRRIRVQKPEQVGRCRDRGEVDGAHQRRDGSPDEV